MKEVAVGCQTPPIPPDPPTAARTHPHTSPLGAGSFFPPSGGLCWLFVDYKAPHISAFNSTLSRTGIQNPQATVQSPAAKPPTAGHTPRLPQSAGSSPSELGHRLPQAWPELRSHLRAPHHPPEDQRLLPMLLALLQLRPQLECLKIKLISPSPV